MTAGGCLLLEEFYEKTLLGDALCTHSHRIGIVYRLHC